MQGELFPMISAAATEPIAESVGRALIEPRGPALWAAAISALNVANDSDQVAVSHGNSHSGRTFGGMLNWFIFQNMTDYFESIPGCAAIESRGLIRVQDVAYLRFRSLLENGLPWPPATPTACRIARQLAEEVRELTDLPVLTVGYRLDKIRASFSYIDVICLRDERSLWWRAGVPEVVEAANTGYQTGVDTQPQRRRFSVGKGSEPAKQPQKSDDDDNG